MKPLNGLVFCSWFGLAYLQKSTESDTMKMVRQDNDWQSTIDIDFHLDIFGMDLSSYIFNP